MKKQLTALAILSATSTAFADFDAQDRHDEACVSCHIIEHDDDFYTREVTRMKTLLDLRRQVSACAAAFNVDWFPEEEAGEVKFLNDKYYKLQK
ncbi:hypothetical protein [uncultured Gammaproteobacteria bacterium]|uniref:hypothetical protein n=1 Tax=Bathymodiolus heckerae thiotrophic gill symbiont TaxID=1052212 RepID=UPI0010BAD688|nr:hypothetical protein [Bathymodiolus heckerae thiotrophic gill symbiont]CAC9586624.1 hypothetical protein [uncultured Gammaproteobacteria bacterium]CAC9590178.1 hypothetical protein [uncultured Gammaproteobacteria bacterium]CAC9592635.1 hypothetical protein [uncultured Gammaproteobacteria bacterium]CAC9955838.1 hypothetical protein [uncultured Gammaproteobacteria bacterium]SHN92122.1 hypothetical protein BHECKSOX_212 [Bathymodiolus heckerae thiotrophic gill symbiont]